MGKLFNTTFDISLIVVQLLFIWLFIALFIPGLNWFNHVYMLTTYLIGYPVEYMFTFFSDYSDHVLATWNPNSNPIEDTVNLMLFVFALASAFFFPAIFLFYWLTIAFLALALFFPSIMKVMHYWTPEAENNWHLLSGRTTVQDTFDAEVLANAIKSAKDRHH